MLVIEIAHPGPPDVLTPRDRPAPVPGHGDVVIQVAAAGVNRPDVLQRLGIYPPPPGASDLPGLEVAGVVESCGSGVVRWKPGDRVCALVAGGGYAERCVAPAGQCLPVPRGLGMVEAAAIPETFFTVWANVFERGGLAGGETLLVHGGASGVGTAAIQLARALGARVFATAGTPEKCAACERIGASRAINYRTEDFVEVIRQETSDRGVDVILDMVAGPYLPRDLQALAMDGRLVLIATLGGRHAELDVLTVMQRRLTITGSTLRPRSVEEKAAIARGLEAHVWPLLDAGRIQPVVYATFPLRQAAEAHRLLESDAHIGKIVLTLAEDSTQPER